MSLLDTFLRGTGGGKLVAALGSLLPNRSKLNFTTTDGTGIAGTDSSGTDTTTITLTHGTQNNPAHHAAASGSGAGFYPALAGALRAAYVRSDGAALAQGRMAVPAIAYDHAYGNDRQRLQAAIDAAGPLFSAIQLESRTYDLDGPLDLHGKQGVVLLGCAGTSFSVGGTTLRFNAVPTPVTGTSASSVASNAGQDVELTFVLNSGTGVVANQPIKFVATAGATTSIWGRVKSIVGTTCVIRAYAKTGSGTGTSWTWTHSPQPLIDFRSTKACGMKGINVAVNTVCINHVIDTGAHPSSGADSDGFVADHVFVRQTTNSGTAPADYQAVHFNFNNAISSGAYLCRSAGALLSMFVGNGPFAVHGCIFSDYSYQACETVAIATLFDSCTWEPGFDMSGAEIQDCVYAHDNSGGTCTLIGCVANDLHVGALGRVVRATALGMLSLVGGNVFSTLATQAPILVKDCEGGEMRGNLFPPGTDKMIEFGFISGFTPYFEIGANTFTGTTPIVGSGNVTDLVQDRATITRSDGSGLPGYQRNFAKFNRVWSDVGLIQEPEAVDVSSNHVAFSRGNIRNSAAGAATIKTIAGLDSGLRIRLWNPTANTITLKHNDISGRPDANYQKVYTPDGNDFVIPASAGTWVPFIDLEFNYADLAWRITAANFPITAHNRDLTGVRTVLYNGMIDNGNSGAAKTIDLGAGSLQKLTLTATCTLTTTAPTAPCGGTLYVYQNGTGTWGLTFPTSRWPSGTSAGGIQPSTAASDLTIYDWEFDGTTIAWNCRGKMVTV